MSIILIHIETIVIFPDAISNGVHNVIDRTSARILWIRTVAFFALAYVEGVPQLALVA